MASSRPVLVIIRRDSDNIPLWQVSDRTIGISSCPVGERAEMTIGNCCIIKEPVVGDYTSRPPGRKSVVQVRNQNISAEQSGG